MSTYQGMDPDRVEAIAHRLKGHAGEITQTIHAVEALVGEALQAWDGSDAHQFRDWWAGQHRPALTHVAEAVGGLGQSALDNAREQRRISSGPGGGAVGASVAATAGAVGAATAVAAPPTAPVTGGVTGQRDWREVQKQYDAWATGRFAAGGVSYYQCTAWANFRWHELGYDGPPINGNGWQMAGNAGPTSHQPSLHAMASYGDGRTDPYGHVMIVEEVRSDGAIRVSEMNATWDNSKSYAANIEGHPDEYRDNRWITRAADGNYYSSKGQVINFAALPQRT